MLVDGIEYKLHVIEGHEKYIPMDSIGYTFENDSKYFDLDSLMRLYPITFKKYLLSYKNKL